MRRLQKSKKVSWASDVSLRQERLFLSEDPPSHVAKRPQNQLQAKKQSNQMYSTGILVAQPSSCFKKKKPANILRKWQCPPTFQLNPNSQVMAGEESKEIEVQNQREMSVLEAFYPHPSAIPPNPSVSSEVKDSYYDDLLTPTIRITPIEEDKDEEEVANPSSHFKEPIEIPISSRASVLTRVERDLVAPASCANFNSVISSTKQESLIDLDLLVKILSNPEMLGTLMRDFGTSSELESAPKLSSPPINFSVPSSCPTPAEFSSKELGKPSSAISVMNVIAPISNPNSPPSGFSHVSLPVVRAHPSPPSPVSNVGAYVSSNLNLPTHGYSHANTPVVKDMNYYKSLIEQHGEEKPKVYDRMTDMQFGNSLKRPNSVVVVAQTKPIMTSRKGSNYAYRRHDNSFGQRFSTTTMPEVHSAKRMKLNREILGRT